MEGLDRYLEKRNIREYIFSIREAGSRAADIVRSLLSFSLKQGSGMQKIDLNDLVAESVKLVRRDYELKKRYGIQDTAIDLRLADDLPRVECSRTEIEHVIISIVRNAVQALHDQGREDPSIRISTGRSDQSGEKVYIDIHDNGPGLDEKIQNRIFEPFFTTKKVGEGDRPGSLRGLFHCTQSSRRKNGSEVSAGKRDNVPGRTAHRSEEGRESGILTVDQLLAVEPVVHHDMLVEPFPQEG